MLSEREKIIVSKAITYANGYRELGMVDNALEELDSLPPKLGEQRAVHEMKLAVLMEAQLWTKALPWANRLASQDSSDPAHLVNLAYVTRRADSLEGARIILENAARRFPKEAIIHYNLGCYAACDDDLDTAKRHLMDAFTIDSKFIKTGIEDEDLIPLRDWLIDRLDRLC